MMAPGTGGTDEAEVVVVAQRIPYKSEFHFELNIQTTLNITYITRVVETIHRTGND